LIDRRIKCLIKLGSTGKRIKGLISIVQSDGSHVESVFPPPIVCEYTTGTTSALAQSLSKVQAVHASGLGAVEAERVRKRLSKLVDEWLDKTISIFRQLATNELAKQVMEVR